MEKKRVLIAADMGELKAYRVVEKAGIDRQVYINNKEGDLKKHSILEDIKELDYIYAHKRKQELTSDKDGNFKGASGEPHNTAIETKKRNLKEIADDITSIVQNEGASEWFLAFPKENSAKLKEMLPLPIKQAMTECVGANLVKTDKNKILSYFQ